VVDLPIQRESHTGFPKIEASSLKGAIRQSFEDCAQNDEDKKKVPIVFTYITCPMILERFQNDIKIGSEDLSSQNNNGEVKTSLPISRVIQN